MSYTSICQNVTCNTRCLLLANASLSRTALQAPAITERELYERSFNHGYRCPHCGSDRLHRHGRYRGRQRLRCVNCKRTFNERTLTPLHGTHYPDKWPVFAACMARGYSLRLTALLVGISLPTAFAWRHKLLFALQAAAPIPHLEGIIELDEVYVLESQKGKRHLNRPARQRGTGRSVTRGPGHDRVCLLAAMDRRDGELFALVGARELHVFQLENVLDGVQFNGTALCVDNRQAYWSFSRRQDLPRHIVTRHSQRRGLHHNGRVDGFLERFRPWLLRFNGVSTRHLGKYAHWFLLYDRAARKGSCDRRFAEELLLNSFDEPVRVADALRSAG